MKTTRRAFIRGTAALAAGAAAGITAFEGIRRHGPVDIKLYFLSEDPIAIKGVLSSDDRRDTFRVHALNERGRVTCIAEMSLSGIRKAVDSWSGRGTVICLCIEERKSTAPFPVAIVVKDGQVNFLSEGRETPPVWISLADVRRVL